MDKKVYRQGMACQLWYNFTESLAFALTYRPTPKNLIFSKKVYGNKKLNYINTYCRKDLVSVKKPLFLYIHGGGWLSGITEMRNPYIANWAQKGFYTASISYTYAPQAVCYETLKEIFTAIDYIVCHADKLNIDTQNVVIAGESAGGYYISFVCWCLQNPEILDKLGIEFKNKDNLNIKALVSHCGCVNLQSLTDESKPQSKFPDIDKMVCTFLGKNLEESRNFLKTEEGQLLIPKITADFPPSFLIWAVNDKLKYETFDLSKTLSEKGVEHKTFKADGIIGNHAWSIVTMLEKAKICLNETFDFVLPHLPEYF